MKTILINAVAGCLTLFISASVHGSYTYTTLDVPGASLTRAYGIDDGNIVGRYYDGSHHGFSYDGSTYTTLDVPGTSATFAYGIDGSNIVGWYSSGGTHGFSYDGSAYTTLNVPGSNSTYAYGIDGANIVGRYVDGSGIHGFSYNGSTYTTLDMPGASNTYAFSIDGSSNHDFRATLGGTAVPSPLSAWIALPLLGIMTVIAKLRHAIMNAASRSPRRRN